MFSTGADGDHNGNGHYMSGVQYKLDGSNVTMAGYTTGFAAAQLGQLNGLFLLMLLLLFITGVITIQDKVTVLLLVILLDGVNFLISTHLSVS